MRNDSGNQVFTYANGTAYPNISEDDLLDAVAMLNRTYNQFDIFFKYTGFGFINNSSLLTVEYSEFPGTISNLSQVRPNTLNLFITNEVLDDDGEQLAGRADFNHIYSLYNKEYLLSATLPHEIAHNFNVYHTRRNYSSTTNCEHINRTTEHCDTRGDEICDTPASHALRGYVKLSGSTYIYDNYNNRTDCNGDVFANVGFTNFMDTNTYNIDNYYKNLRTEFTTGQGVRMRETIANDTEGNFAPARTTIDNLYQPYAGNYASGVYSENSTMNTIKFQKGFDYQFVLCDNPKVIHSTYGVTEIPEGHPYLHAVKILQVSNYTTFNCNIPTKSAYTGGNVIELGESLGGSYTIKELNADEVQDPNLVNTLSNGYNVINTTFDNGQTVQTKIYKQDQ